MSQHSALTGADLHEPKGAASATAGQVYVADGAASGTWQKIGASEVDTTDIFNTNRGSFTVQMTDISTAQDIYIPTPFAGTVEKVTTVIDGAIGTADCSIKIYDSATSLMGTITVANSGSAAGDVDFVDPASNNVFTEDDYIRVNSDGASTGSVNMTIVISVTYTGAPV